MKNNITDLIDKYRNYQPTEELKCNNTYFNYSSDSGFLVDAIPIGSWVLVQLYCQGNEWNNYINTISKPILCIHLGRTVWEMSIIAKLFQIPTRYHYKHNKELGDSLEAEMSLDQQEVTYVTEWNGDDVVLLGNWKSKPTFKELRLAYSKYINTCKQNR
jgi:hypothetical protein